MWDRLPRCKVYRPRSIDRLSTMICSNHALISQWDETFQHCPLDEHLHVGNNRSFSLLHEHFAEAQFTHLHDVSCLYLSGMVFSSPWYGTSNPLSTVQPDSLGLTVVSRTWMDRRHVWVCHHAHVWVCHMLAECFLSWWHAFKIFCQSKHLRTNIWYFHGFSAV